MQYQAIIFPINKPDYSAEGADTYKDADGYRGIATVREANGTTDKEWRLKCRILMTETTRRQALIDELESLGYEVFDAEGWKKCLNQECEDDVPNNFFVSTEVVFDKWDSVPTIY